MSKAGEEYKRATRATPNLNAVDPALVARYKLLFSSPAGGEILADLLRELGLFGTLDFSAEETARHNFAIEILAAVGVLKPDENGQLSQKDMQKIVTALLKVSE